MSRARVRGIIRTLAVAATVLAGVAVLALTSPGGPDLARVLAPRPGDVVGIEGVEVMVRLPDDGRADPATLRVLLNGADVTEQLIRGQNGAYGRLHGVLDGENTLRVLVEGASWELDDRPYEKAREVRFLVRRPLDADRG